MFFNECSLKLPMLELCAPQEGKGTCEEGGDPGPRPPRSEPEAEPSRSGSRRLDYYYYFFFFTFLPATPPMSTLWDEHTSIAQSSTKRCVKRSQPLSLHVEGKNDITREQTGLLISLHLEAHTAVTVIHKAVLGDSYGMTS